MSSSKPRLADGTSLLEILRSDGAVDEAGIAKAERLRRDQGLPLASALVRAGAASERTIAAAMAKQAGLPFVGTGAGDVDPAAAALLPREVALELEALPVAFAGADGLVVAVARPGTGAGERIAELTGMRVTLGLAARGELLRAIEHLADDLGPPSRARSRPGQPGAGAMAAPAPHPAPTPAAGPKPSADTLLAFEQEAGIDLDEVLVRLVEAGGSDLHLTAGSPPALRVRGDLVRLEEYGVLTPPELQRLI